MRLKVIAHETRVGGRAVRRGEVVDVSERERAAAPWAFESVEEDAAEPEPPPPAGLALFRQLQEQDRGNAQAAEENSRGGRRRAARQYIDTALAFLGIKTKADPLALAMRLVDAMGYNPAEDGPDPLAWADAKLEEFAAAARSSALREAFAALEAELREAVVTLRRRDEMITELERRLAAAEQPRSAASEAPAEASAEPAAAPQAAPARGGRGAGGK